MISLLPFPLLAAASAAPAAPASVLSVNANTLWVWMLVLAFPLVMLLLGETLRTLQRVQPMLIEPLSVVRHWTLPALALYLLLHKVLLRPATGPLVRVSETLVWITLIVAALSLLNVILFEGAPSGSWQAKVPRLFRDLGRSLLVLLGSAIVFSRVWGADLGAFLTALGLGSLVLGLALQDSLGNIFAGIALLFEQPIKLGDFVQIGTTIGRVVEVNWRSLHLTTASKDLVVIPNSVLSKGQFTNFSRPTSLHRTQIPVVFSYEDSPNRVRQVLEQAARETANVLEAPAPLVVIDTYGDRGIHYILNFHTATFAEGGDARDELAQRIWFLARRYGLTMPYPTLRQQVWSPPATGVAGHGTALALLQRTPGFAGSAVERLNQLLSCCEVRFYSAFETVLQPMSALDGLYLILSGEAELLIHEGQGRSGSLGVLLSGEFFGEKSSLLHGRLSDTQVRARHDLEVLLIPNRELQQWLLESPRLAADLSEVIAMRQRAIDDLRRRWALEATVNSGNGSGASGLAAR